MSILQCYLLSFNGVEWHLAFLNNSYIASIRSGYCSIGSPRIDSFVASDEQTFYVHFSDSFIGFPISDLEKFKEFNKQVEIFKAAA